ncbi:hypothetical protein MTsPCn5_16930 [Croceitalea sp. MTPC5]|uniref:Uncharacterized protein n=1 Tax=Croceitalea marina TaxID=1775166 RepID=A0ABW5MXZ3_9FLAO|nr:hypothetical protein MTsPCn5_16930 [Croceitalea sp. MTPC5]
MTLYDFLMLDTKEQMTKVMVNGNLVTHLHNGTSSFALYALNTFFVELEYLKEPQWSKQESVVLRKHIFKSGVRMEKYIGKI